MLFRSIRQGPLFERVFVCDEISLGSKSVRITRARWEVARLLPNRLKWLAGMRILDVIFSRIAHVLVNHTGSIEDWTVADAAIPRIFMPGKTGCEVGSQCALRLRSANYAAYQKAVNCPHLDGTHAPEPRRERDFFRPGDVGVDCRRIQPTLGNIERHARLQGADPEAGREAASAVNAPPHSPSRPPALPGTAACSPSAAASRAPRSRRSTHPAAARSPRWAGPRTGCPA